MKPTSPHQPTHGVTKSGRLVHAKTKDHLPAHTAYARFNKRAAILITERVGTMTTTWIFCLLALASLPAILNGTGWLAKGFFPGWLVAASLIGLVAWVAQTFIQLVLLPAIMVGQNVQSEASDARAAKTFEDTERILDQLSLETEGGLATILAAIKELKAAPTPVRRTPRKPTK